MIRFLFRFLAIIALALAVILAVADATRSVAVSRLVVTPLGESWASALPASFAATSGAVQNLLGAAAWDPVMVTILSLPGFVVMAVLALLLQLIGRRKPSAADGLSARG